MRRINLRPPGMLLKKRFMPRFENGGKPTPDVSDLLTYLSQYGDPRVFMGERLDEPRPIKDADLEYNMRQERLSKEEAET